MDGVEFLRPARHQLQKEASTPANRTVPTWQRHGSAGKRRKSSLIAPAGLHRRDWHQHQHGRARGRCRRGERLVARCLTATGRSPPSSPACAATRSRALRHRPADEQRDLQSLSGAVLVPTLKPGDIVVMDNLSSHKTMTCANHRDGRCQAPNLPPYSPDLNRSRWLLQSSRPTCAKPQSDPCRHSGIASAHPRHLLTDRMRELLPPCRYA